MAVKFYNYFINVLCSVFVTKNKVYDIIENFFYYDSPTTHIVII